MLFDQSKSGTTDPQFCIVKVVTLLTNQQAVTYGAERAWKEDAFTMPIPD